MPTLSLLTAYRGKQRETNLKILFRWLQRIRETEGFADFELIVAEGDTVPIVREISSQHEWVRYVFTHMPHVLNKSMLLNRSAAIARGAFLIPLDVDLLPAKGVLQLHVELAAASPRCLLAGYRVQVAEPSLDEPSLPTSETLISSLDIEDPSLLGPEDNPRALRKYLLDNQRFGVCPCFPKTLFERIGGYNEDYRGRGPEDQDIIERVCGNGLTLVRSYDLLYLSHGSWNSRRVGRCSTACG